MDVFGKTVELDGHISMRDANALEALSAGWSTCRQADGTVEADDFTVHIAVGQDGQRQGGELVSSPQSPGKE